MNSQIVCWFVLKFKADEDENEHTKTLGFSVRFHLNLGQEKKPRYVEFDFLQIHHVFELEFEGFEFIELLCSRSRISSSSNSCAHLILGF